LPLQGDADCYNHRDGSDDYTQPRNLLRLFSAEQKQRLLDNIAAAMQGVPDQIKLRQIALFAKCDPAYVACVARAAKLESITDDSSHRHSRNQRIQGLFNRTLNLS
jgi:catalase